jgi:hypothetical protein
MVAPGRLTSNKSQETAMTAEPVPYERDWAKPAWTRLPAHGMSSRRRP